MERTFAYLKPNAIQRGLVGEIIRRIEEKGLKILALKMLMISESKARELYREHAGKDFYEPLLGFIQSGPVVAIVLEGEDAVQRLRILIGKTDPVQADPGSIRGRFGVSVRKNLIHASDSIESAIRETNIFFDKTEILDYSLLIEGQL
ncbi:nucleoside diphosphate kinase [Mesotoga sp. Brook.08.YT.4.2.5.1]|jgi:nucleoside-diphosphate kinase|uniref:nucleoside-diphosphate kinase n=1 Tax=unclassified Mesotoga TaxID=1184398 RepID=UPI000AA708FB|nr:MULTISPECIES: nucleoside-diphosphate kinase [unclassified Mesotoga]PXF34520.1 nucleoside diphosphate kinase [Mesotoga sp. SC_NapDC]RAM60224.1 nucleoside diphosphate kinase [Mesotoga sp. SC_3PWM13N19]MDD3460183.1 nucleoside-diphosphate kinase [Mesotoga sp.]PNE22533.1 nucleoside diphosphate kinase [Mesotoga sp. Brook.08.YT.4.2.5.1]PNS40162.1 nucleoside diphosphate kinase [Mesotoga sp. B105.6.4]